MLQLGYTPAWLKAGVITPELLLEQWQVFQTSDDQSAEHYRHGAFVWFLNQRTEFSDGLLEDLLALEDNDSFGLRELRISMLITSGKLSTAQLNDLMNRTDLQIVPRFQTMFSRHAVLEALKLEGLTPTVFMKIQHSQDKYLHELLLSRADVKREHLLWLLVHGTSKAIRNRAKQMLKAKPFRAV